MSKILPPEAALDVPSVWVTDVRFIYVSQGVIKLIFIDRMEVQSEDKTMSSFQVIRGSFTIPVETFHQLGDLSFKIKKDLEKAQANAETMNSMFPQRPGGDERLN